MKNDRLKGLLLGVSLALLLSGGVALAQGLFMTIDKKCVECWPGPGWPTEDKYFIEVTYGGWATDRPLCQRTWINGELIYDYCMIGFPATDPFTERAPIDCEWSQNHRITTLALGGEASVRNGWPGPLGEWVSRLYQQLDAGGEDWAQVAFLVAEVCEPEFVPEPGSVLLLGSGLAGLAGYATLRLRSGRALRWRTRE